MGCGGSGGVPYAGNIWGKCDPSNPKNYRTRPSIYIESTTTKIVVDTGPDFRTQINNTGMTGNLDAVLYTHAHFDHITGIDDLRAFFIRNNKTPIPVYGTKETLDEIEGRFDYVFKQMNPNYPATVERRILQDQFTIGDIAIESFDQMHGMQMTKGFRIGDFAYSTDVKELPQVSLDKLKGVKTWIIGFYNSEEGQPNHAGLASIREWMAYVKPEMIYLTHMTASADYDQLCRDLPENIRPAYDGLELWI